MYLKRLVLKNIKNFINMTWSPGKDEAPGWHVILGDNGAGKSSFIKAAALIFVGVQDAARTGANFTTWTGGNGEFGTISATIEQSSCDQWTEKGKTSTTPVTVSLRISKEGEVSSTSSYVHRTLWGKGKGWFSASFGPFRRFSGGDPTHAKTLYSYPKVGRHLSAFNEAAALTETLDWLKDLKLKVYESSGKPGESFLEKLLKFINHGGLLPNDASISDVTSEGVIFCDASKSSIMIEDASDGHRSILSLTLEIIRQMTLCYTDNLFSSDNTQIISKGVVLIDEIDVHLHPRWQRTIGSWLCEHFPNIQFIVTTHSPLVCQSAHHGSVFILPRPGSNEKGQMLSGPNLERLLYGNILDAYGSGAFGPGIDRSAKGLELLEKFSILKKKYRQLEDMTDEENTAYINLSKIFGRE